MADNAALIDRLLEEHKVIIRDVQSLQRAANDASLLIGLKEARETFVPGRFDQKHGLQKLQEMLAAIDKGLRAHFNREETLLLAEFEKHGDRKLVTTLNSLLLEHEDLRNRLDHAKVDIDELMNGKLARQRWEASANDMRAHLSHTRKLLEAHAAVESELLLELRRYLKGESARKEKT